MKKFSNQSTSSQKPERNTEYIRSLVSELEAQAERFIRAIPVIYDELDRIDELGQCAEPDPVDPDPVDPEPKEPLPLHKFKHKAGYFPIPVPFDYYQDAPLLRQNPSETDEREKFDIYIPKYTKKDLRPLVVFGHGGGFHSYSKAVTRSVRSGIDIAWDFPRDIATLQDEGIAFLSLGYKFLNLANPKKSARSWELLDRMDYSLQFLKYHAPDFGVDPDRITLAGISAGSFWAHRAFFSPDKAIVNHSDPVRRMSTKPFTIATRFTHTTEDVRIWENEIFKEFNFNMLEMYSKLTPQQKAQHLSKFQASFGIEKMEDLYNPSIIDAVMDKVNAVKHIHSNTPEFWIACFWDQKPKNPSVLGHHGNHARWLHQYALGKGQTNHTAYWGPEGSGKEYSNRPKPESWMEYVIRKSFS